MSKTSAHLPQNDKHTRSQRLLYWHYRFCSTLFIFIDTHNFARQSFLFQNHIYFKKSISFMHGQESFIERTLEHFVH